MGIWLVAACASFSAAPEDPSDAAPPTSQEGGSEGGAETGVLPDTGPGTEPEGGLGCTAGGKFGPPVPIQGIPVPQLVFGAVVRSGIILYSAADDPSLDARLFAGKLTGNVVTDITTIGVPNVKEIYHPTVSADGNFLFASGKLLAGSTRDGGSEVFRARRVGLMAFDPANAVFDGQKATASPFVFGNALYLAIEGTTTGFDLAVVTTDGNGEPIDAPLPLSVNTNVIDLAPKLSADGLQIVYATDRPGGPGKLDIWTATRSSIASAFMAPVLVEGVNSGDEDVPFDLSPDGCSLYLGRGLTGKGFRLLVSRRQ